MIRPFTLTLIVAGLLAQAALAQDDPNEDLVAKEQKRAADMARVNQTFADKFQATLAAGYTVKVDYYLGTDRIETLTPLDANGRPDGEAVTITKYGWDTIRTVPYVKGVRQGAEKVWGWDVQGKERTKYLDKEIPWLDGKVTGVRKTFHPNGRVKSETPCVNDVVNGRSCTYDLAGRLEREATFVNGKRNGEMTEYWSQTGKPKRIVPYTMGRTHGLIREFHDNGRLKREVPVADEEYHGIERQFDESGSLLVTKYWLRDKEVAKEQFEKDYTPATAPATTGPAPHPASAP